jgi:hypothetical protein
MWPWAKNLGQVTPAPTVSSSLFETPITPSATQFKSDPTPLPFPSPSPMPIDGLAFSYTQITALPNGDVTVRTVINSIANGNRKPIIKLSPRDFLITEQFDTKSKTVKVLVAKASSTRADIVILIDTSGSMAELTDIKGPNGNNLTKLDVVKKSVLLFVNDLVKSNISSIDGIPSRIAFLPFSSNGINFIVREGGDIWFPTLPESKDEIQKNINSLKPEGNTPLYDAIVQALEVIQQSKNYRLAFCLTDGLDNMSRVSVETMRSTFENSNTPIITVGYGSQANYDADALEKISWLSGAGSPGLGSYINISPKEVSGVFRRLSGDLNNIYEIHWKSAFPQPGNNIIAEIVATYKIASGDFVSAKEIMKYQIPIIIIK